MHGRLALVADAGGFLGGHLAARLVRDGWRHSTPASTASPCKAAR